MNKSIIRSIGLISIFMSFLYACAPRQELVVNSYVAPVLLPGTESQMNAAGFWIGMHPDPDRVVIPAKSIDTFNKSIRRETGTVLDITAYPKSIKGRFLSNTHTDMLQYIASKKYIQQDGKKVDKAFLGTMKKKMNIASIPSKVSVRFGFVTSYTHQRLIPTDTPLYSNMKSLDIDRLQNSALEIGTPLAVLHESRDKQWLYAISPLSEGWVSAEHVGICSRERMKSYLKEDHFVVTTGTKADVFLDPALRSYHAFVRMGTRLPAKKTGDQGVTEVILPFRGPDGACVFKGAYIAENDASSGYLPYTPRTIIQQAFKLLHAPYGWGDMHGEQDCSRFIQQIFSTVGIQLPRNSLQQARVGRLIAKFNGTSTEKNRLVALSDNSIGGISILHMSGHIMLFLGNVNGDPFAIHDIQGYSELGPDGERRIVVNRVVVSNLRIGEGTKSGTFLKRLVTVRSFEKSST